MKKLSLIVFAITLAFFSNAQERVATYTAEFKKHPDSLGLR
ncbi:hypothetical protein [Mucilaginibacter antarcticus]